MKKILIIFLIFIVSCSFDDKSGIWNNNDKLSKKKLDLFDEFKTLSSPEETFNKTINIQKNFEFILPSKKSVKNWNDFFYNNSNNFDNFNYSELNKLKSKSKKIFRHENNEYFLLEENNVILSNKKGFIFIFSLNEQKIISQFNFYKKNFKKIPKLLNFIVENNIIYVIDNIGYIYAFDYKSNKLIWAKYYKVPFKSNIKIFKNKIICANQNNDLYFIDKLSGNILSQIPTEEIVIKNQFINNISISENSTFFLNTFGSLYAIDSDKMNIRWFLNLNQSTKIDTNNFYSGNEIIHNNEKIVVSSNKHTYILDLITGSITHKKNFKPLVKPVITKRYLFAISDKDFLLAIDLKSGKLIYSYDINKKIAEFYNIKKNTVDFKNMMLVNNKIFIFLKNSYVLKFLVNGELEQVIKLPSKINTQPIIVSDKIIYLNNKNKLLLID